MVRNKNKENACFIILGKVKLAQRKTDYEFTYYSIWRYMLIKVQEMEINLLLLMMRKMCEKIKREQERVQMVD